MFRHHAYMILVAAALVVGAAYWITRESGVPPVPDTKPAPASPTKPTSPKKRPLCPNCPNCPQLVGLAARVSLLCPCGCGCLLDDCRCCALAQAQHPPQLGGAISPDGKTRIVIYEDSIQWPKNIASNGLGCCTFRSLDYAARLQNEPRLVGLPETMKQDHVSGGGYPEKLDQLIQRYDPEARYWNDTSKSVDILTRCWLSKRISCVDYNGHDPHYNGGIAHCVCVVAYDSANDWVAILDNNYPSLAEIVWMGTKEFSKRWGGWSYGLFNAQVGAFFASPEVTEPAPLDTVQGVPGFGLIRSRRLDLEKTIEDGKEGSVESILNRLGGEMVPKIEPTVNSKITIDPSELVPAGAVIVAGGFVLWLILDTRSRK